MTSSNNDFVTSKRKIGHDEKLLDLNCAFDNCDFDKRQKTHHLYTLIESGFNLYVGNFNHFINIKNLAEFIDIKYDAIQRVETREFYRNDNKNKIIKKNPKFWFNCIRLAMSLNIHSVQIDIFSNGRFFVRRCASISNATDAVEKLLFEMDHHECSNLFYNKN